ncbi:SPOR domain-containing protein [Massilia sp. TWR1-2-2]|uniref:SPOR domain-containing protein n=1 Tax=Massilia sp. TWR1-2-2 TaxID=2804584 RepID=UPI003CE77A14
MLKFIFWCLLCLNGVLLAYGQGMLGNFKGNEREPARIKNQLNIDKLAPLPGAPAALAAAAVPVLAAPRAEALACFELGNFAEPQARRFEARLAPLDLGERVSRQALAEVDVTSYMVIIPPQGSREAADKKAGELKALGVTNFFIVSDNAPLKWAISLGVFKSETAAQSLLATLTRQGVNSARINPRGAAPRLTYQFRGIDAAARAKIDDIAEAFPALETRGCK